MIYPPKIDAWLGVLLAALALTAPVSVIAGLRMLKASPGEATTFIFSGVFTGLLLALLVWPVRYVLDERELVIRFGIMRVRIPYKDIQEVSPTRTLLAGPALSLDRLMISYRGGRALISPSRKENFLQELAKRDPGLTLAGDRVLRR